jgi:hypothetical protein
MPYEARKLNAKRSCHAASLFRILADSGAAKNDAKLGIRVSDRSEMASDESIDRRTCCDVGSLDRTRQPIEGERKQRVTRLNARLTPV